MHSHEKPGQQNPWRLLLAILCVLLVLVSGSIQAVHMHANGDVSHADCSLCVTAHVAQTVAAPVVSLSFIPVIFRVETVATTTRVRSICVFALYIRPPPADIALA